MGSKGSIGVQLGVRRGSKIIMNSIGWPLNPGLLGHVINELKHNTALREIVILSRTAPHLMMKEKIGILLTQPHLTLKDPI